MQGPKIRLGDIQGGTVVLQKGQRFTLRTTDCIGTDKEARVDHEQMTKDVTIGAKILLNDGAVELIVKRIGEKEIETEVIIGGPIGSRKSVNLPGTKISLPALTKKDERDLQFLLREEVDMVACSFVREAVHLHEVHQFIFKS